MAVDTRSSIVDAVEAYLTGLRSKDLSKVPFAPDVSFQGPLNPDPLTGTQAVAEFLTSLFPAIRDARSRQHIVEGEYCAVLFDLDTTYGVIPVFDLMRVQHGRLVQIRPFWDPRPITNPAG